MPQKQHEKAAAHHEEAAKHHKEAAKHASNGNHEKSAYHAQAANGHHKQAGEHAAEASKKYAKKSGSMKEETDNMENEDSSQSKASQKK